MTPQPTRKRESSSYDGWLYVETEAVCTCACMCELTKVALTEIALSSALTLHCGLCNAQQPGAPLLSWLI